MTRAQRRLRGGVCALSLLAAPAAAQTAPAAPDAGARPAAPASAPARQEPGPTATGPTRPTAEPPARPAEPPAPAPKPPAPAAPTEPPAPAQAQPTAPAPPAESVTPAPQVPGRSLAPLVVDRVAVRFTAPETGGIDRPQFIFERELAFEARLEAFTDASFQPSEQEPYVDRHVRAALERHMAEVLLSHLEITPEPTPRDVAARGRAARLTLAQQVGGDAQLEAAARAEEIAPSEVSRLLARRARASLYLDRMVATMLTPSDTELRIVHRTTRTPFTGADYEAIAPMLQRWYVAQRLNVAVRAFYEGARSRIEVTLVGGASALGGGPERE